MLDKPLVAPSQRLAKSILAKNRFQDSVDVMITERKKWEKVSGERKQTAMTTMSEHPQIQIGEVLSGAGAPAAVGDVLSEATKNRIVRLTHQKRASDQLKLIAQCQLTGQPASILQQIRIANSSQQSHYGKHRRMSTAGNYL